MPAGRLRLAGKFPLGLRPAAMPCSPQITREVRLRKKRRGEQEDMMGGEKAWANAPKTDGELAAQGQRARKILPVMESGVPCFPAGLLQLWRSGGLLPEGLHSSVGWLAGWGVLPWQLLTVRG